MNLPFLKKYPFIYFVISQFGGLFFVKLFAKSDINLQPFNALVLHILIAIFISQLIFRLPIWFFYISVIFPILLFVDYNYIHLESYYYGFLFFFRSANFFQRRSRSCPFILF